MKSKLLKIISIFSVSIILLCCSYSFADFSDAQKQAADINHDGKIDSKDLDLIVDQDFPPRPQDGVKNPSQDNYFDTTQNSNGTSNEQNTPSTGWLKVCKEEADRIVKEGYKYKNGGGNKATDCARYVSGCLVKYGVLDKGQRIYSTGEIHYAPNKVAVKHKIQSNAQIIKVKTSLKKYSKQLQPGDICCWANPTHINVFAGFDSKGNYTWYDAGTSATKTKREGSQFVNIGPRERWNKNGKDKKILHYVIRLNNQ